MPAQWWTVSRATEIYDKCLDSGNELISKSLQRKPISLLSSTREVMVRKQQKLHIVCLEICVCAQREVWLKEDKPFCLLGLHSRGLLTAGVSEATEGSLLQTLLYQAGYTSRITLILMGYVCFCKLLLNKHSTLEACEKSMRK